MATKLEALKVLLDEAILESRREIESNPSPSKSRRSLGPTSSSWSGDHVFSRLLPVDGVMIMRVPWRATRR